jgi:hypothetical protein
MSDLAPFVTSVLYDKVLAEMKQELDQLSEQLEKSPVAPFMRKVVSKMDSTATQTSGLSD